MAEFVDRFLGLTPDPRSNEMFLMRSPLKVITILTLYALFVTKLGPRLMKNRQPFELKGALIVYNSCQVFINAYLFYKCLSACPHTTWIGRCLRVDEKYTESVEMTRRLFHVYCMLKMFDLLDTVFFVLRKRYNQVSFLHVYHHIMICLGAFQTFRYVFNGHIGVLGATNCLVHTVMYSYYLLSSLRPDGRSSIWWKKYLTLLQMVQFVFLVGFTLYPWMNGETCGYPSSFLPFVSAQNVLMFVLFSKFYYQAYIRKPKPKVK